MRACVICLTFAVAPYVSTRASAQEAPPPQSATTAVQDADSPRTERPLPDGTELVRSMVDRQRSFEEAMDTYSYDVVQTEEQLDGKGRVKNRRVRRYEIFFVQGTPVRKLVESDGKPLSPSDQEKEERRARKEAEKAARRKKHGAEDNGSELRISKVLDRFDFTALSRQVLDGRTTVLVEFRPQPGKRDIKQDNVLRALEGRLWIDEEERVVLRAEINNTKGIKIGGGLLASISSFDVKMDFRQVDTVWLPRRTEAFATGRMFLLKGFRARVFEDYSNFRRFEVTTEEHVAGVER